MSTPPDLHVVQPEGEPTVCFVCRKPIDVARARICWMDGDLIGAYCRTTPPPTVGAAPMPTGPTLLDLIPRLIDLLERVEAKLDPTQASDTIERQAAQLRACRDEVQRLRGRR